MSRQPGQTLVHILFRNFGYEGGDILKVYRSKPQADADLAWLRTCASQLRRVEWLSPMLVAFHNKFGDKASPGDSYHVESHLVCTGRAWRPFPQI